MASLVTRPLRPLLSSTSGSLGPALTRHYAQRSWDDEDESPRRPYSDSGPPPKRPKGLTRMPRNPPLPGPPSEQELAKRAKMRVERAERLERKDLTAQLTPTKTYMGGFTQPQHLAFLNTRDPTRKAKDSYDVRIGQNRVRPDSEAYEPHVVYLAVTRYPVKWPGHGRAVRRETFSGFCKESELAQEFRELNYGRWRDARVDMVKEQKGKPKKPVQIEAGWTCKNESVEYIDHALWPGSPQERSYLNKPIYAARKARDKMLKRAAEDPSLDASDFQVPELLPRVPDSWKPPSPPYLKERLIVPLLTISMPTRPLASTLARLCNSHPRGLTFVASVADSDRKDGPAFFRRLLRMRADRIRELTTEIIQKLQGYGGGLFGLRLSAEDKGRGVEGEMLGEDIAMPEGGWSELRWLDKDSSVWEGIEREVFRSSWEGVEGVRSGESLKEDARSIEEQDQGRVSDEEYVRAKETSAGGSDPEAVNTQ